MAEKQNSKAVRTHKKSKQKKNKHSPIHNYGTLNTVLMKGQHFRARSKPDIEWNFGIFFRLFLFFGFNRFRPFCNVFRQFFIALVFHLSNSFTFHPCSALVAHTYCQNIIFRLKKFPSINWPIFCHFVIHLKHFICILDPAVVFSR